MEKEFVIKVRHLKSIFKPGALLYSIHCTRVNVIYKTEI